MRITFYSNGYDERKEKQARREIFENYADEYGWWSEDDVPIEMVQNEVDEENSYDWKFFMEDLKELLKKKHCLMTGTFGSWRGPREGGKFVNTTGDFIACIQHLDEMNIYEENGHLYVAGSHHDGSDFYELKVLTKKGYALADYNHFAHDRKLHNTLFNCNFYSALPRLSKCV
ncbi:MAG: hypothetical protein IKD26_02160 [Clostridia bacterium]|nr:hypothetical protein [Clostridia bacterium]